MTDIIGFVLLGLGVFSILQLLSMFLSCISMGQFVHADSKPKAYKISTGYFVHVGVFLMFLGIGLMIYG